MSSVDPNKADLNIISNLSIPGALVSKNAKLVDSSGNEVKTKAVLKTLERLVTNLQSEASALTQGSVDKINAVQGYLTVLLSARDKGGIIPSKLNPSGLSTRMDQLSTIKKLFEKAVANHGLSLPSQNEGWSYDEKEMKRTFTENGDNISISRNAENQVTVKTETVDSIASKKDLKARVLQVNSDMKRKAESNSDFVQFKDSGIEGSTVREKLQSFIGKINANDQNLLMEELHAKLPESLKTSDHVADLSAFYEMPETEANKTVAILAEHVRLSSSSTTLLTSFLRLGGAADASEAFRNPTNFTSTLEITRDSEGHERPLITAANKDPLDVKTGPRTKSVSTHTGAVSAVCDPIKGSIVESFVITPKK